MNYKNYILILFFIPFINIYSQDIGNLKVGKYDGKVFSIVDSIGEFYIYKRDSAFSKNTLDGQEYKSNYFTIEILKSLKFSKLKLNIPQAKYIFSNDDGETLVIQEFMDSTREKITTIESMPPCIEPSESIEKRYTCFYIKDRYLIYYYNVKSENNSKLFNSMQSIKEAD